MQKANIHKFTCTCTHTRTHTIMQEGLCVINRFSPHRFEQSPNLKLFYYTKLKKNVEKNLLTIKFKLKMSERQKDRQTGRQANTGNRRD